MKERPTVCAPNLSLRFAGVLLGTAVGDALGLPAEGLSGRRIQRRWQGQWEHRFLFGRGMISDDTEHTLLVAQALLSHSDNPDAFQRLLGWKFRWWFAGLPGGVGLATAKACLKLWIGFPTNKCAVASGGSGPAMRSAIIGAYFADAPAERREFVLASSRLTHRSWQAETAALAVAEMAALALNRTDPPVYTEVLPMLRELSAEREWQNLMAQLGSGLAAGQPVSIFADRLAATDGVSGYSLHVVSVAIYAWLRHPGDFRSALIAVLNCGGDTDTVGAILGGIAGAAGGEGCVPAEWVRGIWEWPHSRAFIKRVASKLAEQKASGTQLGPVRYFWPGLIPRNFLFLLAVLTHGLRRLVPP